MINNYNYNIGEQIKKHRRGKKTKITAALIADIDAAVSSHRS
jgi:hypothetical protein